MKINITGRQIDIGEAFTAHIHQAIEALTLKYFEKPLEAQIVVSKDKHHQISIEINLHVAHQLTVRGHAHGTDPYSTFTIAHHNIEKQLRRYKNRLKDHHHKNGHVRNGELPLLKADYRIIGNDENSPEEDNSALLNPAIIAEMSTEIPTLTVSEAVMRMDLAASPIMMFCNSAHGGFNVVYRRQDGNIGWIDPEEKKKIHQFA